MKSPLFALLIAVLGAAPLFAQNNPDCIVLNCPTNVDVDCTDSSGIARWEFSATSTCGQSISAVCTPPSGSEFPPGVTTVTCTAADSAGNTKSCAFTVRVHRDLTPPTLQLPAPMMAPCADGRGAVVEFAVTATDNCSGPVPVTCTPSSGSMFPIGTNAVTCRALDPAGNATIGTFQVIVSSACANCVQLSCPPDPIVVPAGRQGTAAVEYDVSATNRCDGDVKVVCVPPSGSDFPIGTNTVQCAAFSDGALVQRCDFQVIVQDQLAPVLKVPSTMNVLCGGWSIQGRAGRALAYTVTATDNADPSPQVACTPPSGSFFPLGTNLVTCTAVDNAGNRSTKSFAIIVSSGPACEVAVPDPDVAQIPDNWDFEYGLSGWTKSGEAFDPQPTLGDNVTVQRIPALKDQLESNIGGDYWPDLGYPIGHHGRFWIGTAENHPDDSTPPGSMLGNQAKGWLRSKQFAVEHNYISFLVGGDEDAAHLRVELLVETAPNTPGAEEIAARWYRVVAAVSGHGQESLRRAMWDVRPYLGRWARIRIVDDSASGHLNVDNFRFQDEHPYWSPITIGCTNILPVVQQDTLFFDWDAPVWGFADTHTHPMSYLGLGGKVMHGNPGGIDAPTVPLALGDCNCSHGGKGVDNDCGDYYRQLVIGVMDDKGNSPHREGYSENPWKQFRNWPVFSTITHQQMWHEWIRRAYDGGLRVMVALCVNNELLAKASKGDLERDDKTVGDNQIQAMKIFAALHSDFCEIAYDPFQLRRIVRDNKLAIVLGSELDSIGNLSQLSAVSADATNGLAASTSELLVRAEIQRLYGQGIRYMFPVHLVDNKFGGTAVGNLMLDVANKFYNGSAFDLEAAPATDFINYKMDDLDFTGEAVGAGVGALVLGPALPTIGPVLLDLYADMDGAGTLAGASASIGVGLLPIATIAAANLVLFNAIGVDPIPPEIWPVGGNFPTPPATDHGHRNRRGLTPLGQFALKEMMRSGMMLDIDHMSHHTLTNVFAIAEQVPGGYPLNSGHNSPRDLAKRRNENHRLATDYERLFKLGGLAGVGFENSDVNAFESYGPVQIWSTSSIENDNAGTSKTFGQNYLYAFEKMRGRQIAFGTDIDGFIVTPGPRFGPQAAFGISDADKTLRDDQIRAQGHDGVLYTPKHGRPLTTAAFVGPSVDPDRDTDEPARHDKGYAYNQDQRDFFAAIRIFASNPIASEDDLKVIEDALSDNYPNKRRVKEYAFGLVKGVTGAEPGSDILSPDTGTREQLGKAVYRYKVLGIAAPAEIVNDEHKWFRFNAHCTVWDDYHKIFGTNTPMKRCRTEFKEWDINFEGVAHYGLMPDFLQDLRNVGLNAHDMSPLFLSAEDFARMWVKTLKASGAINKPALNITPRDLSSYWVEWYADADDVLEVTANLGDPNSWQPFTGEMVEEGGYRRAVVQTSSRLVARFFRVRRP